MLTRSKVYVALALLSLSVFAQSLEAQSSGAAQPQAREVTAFAFGEQARFTSLGELIQIRLEVINSSGGVVFDSGFKAGNVLDWSLKDNQDKGLADGSYLCRVTVKYPSGQISRRNAIASFIDQSVTLKQPEPSLLTAAQAEAAGMEGQDNGLTILEPGGSAATAVVAHDGGQAHLVSGSGGLSISSGDFFAKKLLEQMRLTAEGNVGIGVSDPQARLDVAGRIRASEGIVFPDGSVQFSASRKTFGAASLKPGQSQRVQGQDAGLAPDASGTGTTGKIPKWLDGPNAVLTDSIITELNGNIGINGPPDPTFKLDVTGHNRFRGPSVTFYLTGQKVGGNEWAFQTVDADGRLRIFDNTTGAERFSVSQNGNVGIGATNPASRLDVAGAINTSSQYKIGDLRVLSVAGAGNLFAGVGAGNSNTQGAANSFFGEFAGLNNTTGNDNSFFGGNAGFSNTEGVSNSFFGRDAGLNNTTGAFNSFFGRNAGSSNTEGFNNSFFGTSAGFHNTTGVWNSFFGTIAGQNNTAGSYNSFFGRDAGANNTTGAANSFFGIAAGFGNTTEDQNTFIGAQSSGQAGITNATAIGYAARVTRSNSLVLGQTNDTNVGIGTTSPDARLHVKGASSAETTPIAILDSSGSQIPLAFKIGAIEHARIRVNSVGDLTLATVNGTSKNIRLRAGDDVATDLFIEGSTGRVGIGSGNTNPSDLLDVDGDIRVGDSGTNGCLRNNNGGTIVGTCSSDLRFKRDLTPFGQVLNKVTRLQPVYYFWRAAEFPEKHFGAAQEAGLIAQEVEQVLPELVKQDAQGYKMVDYSRLPLLTIQALKELNDVLRKQNAALEARLATLEQMMQQLREQPQQPKRQ